MKSLVAIGNTIFKYIIRLIVIPACLESFFCDMQIEKTEGFWTGPE
jgi:hypothetical protein